MRADCEPHGDPPGLSIPVQVFGPSPWNDIKNMRGPAEPVLAALRELVPRCDHLRPRHSQTLQDEPVRGRAALGRAGDRLRGSEACGPMGFDSEDRVEVPTRACPGADGEEDTRVRGAWQIAPSLSEECGACVRQGTCSRPSSSPDCDGRGGPPANDRAYVVAGRSSFRPACSRRAL